MSSTKKEKRKATHPFKTFWRLIKTLNSFYPVIFPLITFFSVVSIVISVLPAVFLQRTITVVEATWETGDWSVAQGAIAQITLVLIGCFLVGAAVNIASAIMTTLLTHGSLMKLRNKMFAKMQKLPISHFDQNSFGDIMSHYTNDIETLSMLINQGIFPLITSLLGMLCVLGIMLWFSVWMTLIVLIGVLVSTLAVTGLGANAGRYYRKQQEEIGKLEGFIEEAITGAKTIKIFTHECQTMEAFDKANESWHRASRSANRYANVLAPTLFNLGNVLYVCIALFGGYFLLNGVDNLSISGLPFSIAIVIPFLNMAKQFIGLLGTISRTANALIMGIAGTERIFTMIDLEPEDYSGSVSLVQHGNSLSWHDETRASEQDIPVAGDVSLEGVYFGYKPDHTILHDLSFDVASGQKVAFVGATGAGKTTITNLLNRFYEIDKGSIRYDGIDIADMKKDQLRQSLGMVLQDTNLFMGSVMDNIRYGRLDATDEECIEAAKLANADQFIQRLPQGYDTQLSNNGTSLSQGQRQLISIARAAVANPPVMILDEATSSVDTRTEALVQQGMDALMQDRTTFVIAHRLSTVRNADLICVLDHGRIIERGTHDELLARKGVYYQLYTGAFELE